MQDQTSFSDAKFCSSDVALSPVQGTSLSQISEEEVLKSNIWWKLDLAVLPVVTMIFFLSFLVRHPISIRFVAYPCTRTGAILPMHASRDFNHNWE